MSRGKPDKASKDFNASCPSTSNFCVVDNEVTSKISKGLMVLVGISTGLVGPFTYLASNTDVETDDTMADASILINKILSLRVFNDPAEPDKMWKASVKDIDGEILCVSQFTLYGNTTKGNKPDFHKAMGAESSREFYHNFLEQLKNTYKPEKIQGNPAVCDAFFLSAKLYMRKDGRFGAVMNVSLTNEGPVTFTIDSRKFEYVDSNSSSGKKSDKKGSAPTPKSPSP
ncbi:hypothetical protein D9758_000914 [Tetrapyrgos nigripes]|uniref:D-aminoacyl-tRNA deacylase n=1 Tax=Tetrapyrgos nigripes TaxID=182062 RepID=A0A8H5LXD3_9AGAR|nr:hypothetical protein D9758_000914 [Tetrapyrgos nigripes]